MAILVDMNSSDPLSPFQQLGDVAALIDDTTAAIAVAHRRPAALRRADIIVGESVLRGAKLSGMLDGAAVEDMVSPYAVLSPETAAMTAQTFLRAPSQVFARLDVAAGGEGKPSDPQRMEALARLITAPGVSGLLLAQVVHFEVAGRELFGSRSGVVGRVSSRCAALATGVDPLGICVPETYYNRHREDYAVALTGWVSGDRHAVTQALEFGLRAWIAGAEEADGIARAA
ncbi:hypothetical protein QP027_00635 [Corynebacterium breve]|uniref:Oxidoreductase n=1 Tax=Corynebacterium breve TaxID=3049799 RepID=A0ABY8VK39_9CORY|nr:hypothetical protein [Corynebacterium breve]WIM67940.1 hypothetical protein QP027_00635 [Corynebacterium breve]